MMQGRVGRSERGGVHFAGEVRPGGIGFDVRRDCLSQCERAGGIEGVLGVFSEIQILPGDPPRSACSQKAAKSS